jgi:hypothetical protein
MGVDRYLCAASLFAWVLGSAESDAARSKGGVAGASAAGGSDATGGFRGSAVAD